VNSWQQQLEITGKSGGARRLMRRPHAAVTESSLERAGGRSDHGAMANGWQRHEPIRRILVPVDFSVALPKVALVAAAVLVAACSARPAELPSRVAYQPLQAKLAASGGSPDRILHPRAPGDLDRLEGGRRYKFVVDARGAIAVAPLPADAPGNEYVHPILAGGGPVRTAGGIRIERANGAIQRIVVDQDSKSYCPPLASLGEAARALAALGVPSGAIQKEDRPPECAAK
jgi:hypothetical protein